MNILLPQVGQSVAQFELGDYKNFVYLVMDWETREAGIIDPQKDLRAPLGFLKENQFKLSGIFITHTHSDHTAGVTELVQTNPNITIYVHQDELFRLDQNLHSIRTIQEGDSISIGQLTLKVLHTPGHSQGECCFLLKGASTGLTLFTGDTLFIRDCGRTDFETGNTLSMFQSLQRLKTLPKETLILPGHHYQPECSSTLEQELRESPVFRCQSAHELEVLP